MYPYSHIERTFWYDVIHKYFEEKKLAGRYGIARADLNYFKKELKNYLFADMLKSLNFNILY
jgi:DNA-binding Xre family transcriptional regulator